MEFSEDIKKKLTQLEEKYKASGQDMSAYLEGLFYADYINYWNYIHLETLLSLQTPITNIPDEEIFIIYHQITELYFKLCLHELKQISDATDITAEYFAKKIKRINRYFDALIASFEVMVEGMEPQQFLKFRMSLMPASGFQSVQYRTIEFYATDFHLLLNNDKKKEINEHLSEAGIDSNYSQLYWKTGASELSTGKKTLTLKQFEVKYDRALLQLAKDLRTKNINQIYVHLSAEEKKHSELMEELRKFDLNVNVKWPLSHYKSAVKYLQKNTEDIKATGGTNWQKYLPPKFQRRIFYPELWQESELADWGTILK
jgi:tryptophan 2,3-dioxygenase